MSAILKSLILRNMRESPAFTRCEDLADLPGSLSLERHELPVGWYRNPPPWEASVIIFTSQAMYLSDGGAFERLSLDEIVDYEMPREKRAATGVRVRTPVGFRFIRMAGRNGPDGKFCDVFSLVMALHVLVSDGRRSRVAQGPPVDDPNGQGPDRS